MRFGWLARTAFFLRLLALGSWLLARSFQQLAVGFQENPHPCSDFGIELRFWFAYTSARRTPLRCGATVAPKILNFGSVFQCNYRTSTSTVRVLSLSRWLTTPLKQNCDNI